MTWTTITSRGDFVVTDKILGVIAVSVFLVWIVMLIDSINKCCGLVDHIDARDFVVLGKGKTATILSGPRYICCLCRKRPAAVSHFVGPRGRHSRLAVTEMVDQLDGQSLSSWRYQPHQDSRNDKWFHAIIAGTQDFGACIVRCVTFEARVAELQVFATIGAERAYEETAAHVRAEVLECAAKMSMAEFRCLTSIPSDGHRLPCGVHVSNIRLGDIRLALDPRPKVTHTETNTFPAVETITETKAP